MNDAPNSAPAPRTFPSWTAPRHQLLNSHPWLVYVLPFAVFLILTSLEPTPPPQVSESPSQSRPIGVPSSNAAPSETSQSASPSSDASEAGNEATHETSASSWIPYRYYPLAYTIKFLATLAAIAWVWPGYRQYPWKLNPICLAVGVMGVFVWIGICQLEFESYFWNRLGWETLGETGGRSQYNPLVELADWPLAAGGFLVIRFLGLVAIVPLIEEFFLRGFVMRFVMADRWWEIPFGQANAKAILLGTLVPMMLHPGELIAAAVWFSLVTWMMLKTRNIWDCVAAHAVTNLLLGLYAVSFNQWQFL